MSDTIDTWTWWESRRLRYNLGIAAAGWVAYGLFYAVASSYGAPFWRDGRNGLATTLALGVGFLLAMALANICYLIGPALEAWMRPERPDAYRRSAYRLGFLGSIALPFTFPLFALAICSAAAR